MDDIFEFFVKPDALFSAPIFVLLFAAIGTILGALIIKLSSVVLSMLSPHYRLFRIRRMERKLEFVQSLSEDVSKLMAYTIRKFAWLVILLTLFIFTYVDSQIALQSKLILTSIKGVFPQLVPLLPLTPEMVVVVPHIPITVGFSEFLVAIVTFIALFVVCTLLLSRLSAVQNLEKFQDRVGRKIEKIRAGLKAKA